MSDFEVWLRSLGLERYHDLLAGHDIDLEVAPELNDGDLERLGLSLGHRRKFIAAAARLRDAGAAATPAPAPAASRSTSHPSLVERRQVTVVFADLVDSTALSSQLDPEDLQRLLNRYRETCAAIVARYDGHVAQYLGDGIMAYFGYPRAFEYAEERAVRAGLEIAREVAHIVRPDGTPLQTRLGIASGLVVSDGAADASEQTVVGDTPNLAARLQALAEPGTVLVSEATRQLTGNFFEYAPHGEHRLKGFAAAQPAWTALRERAVQSRFAAARSSSIAPMVGRERELAFLLDSWERACAGNGHLVLVGGDAGMGKSRMLEAVAGKVQATAPRLLRCQCSPYHRNSALHPFAQMLRHALEIGPEYPADEKLARVEAMLARLGRTGKAGRVLLADLLELTTGETLSAMEMTPAQRKNETLGILEQFIEAEAAGSVLLLLVEDAHWIDPTSSALIERLLKRIDRERMLALVSHRPEWVPGWNQHPNASSILCKPLGRAPCADMVRTVAARHAIDEAKVLEIVQRSDGVPLFAEELTKAVIDLRAGDDAQVPATLRDSLMARLDRLGDAKSVAQTAAVIGREFDFATLVSVAELGTAVLDAALARLLQSGLVFDVGETEERVYSFNHILVQEEAYESLSKSRRVELHRRVAALLESGTSMAHEAPPELIAHHHGRAGDAAKACHYWLQAAERARQRSAFAESIAHLHAALAEAARIADADASARFTLSAQLRLGATMVMQRGPQAESVEEAMSKARTLAQARDAGPELFQATWGLYLHAATNLRFDVARQYGNELIAISDRLADDDLNMEALHHRWGIAYFTGDIAPMLEHTAAGIDRYDASRHHRFAHVFGGHDLGVCAHCVRGIALALSGSRQSVVAQLDAGIALAESLEHPISLGFVLGNASTACWMAGDADGAAAFAERLLAVATRYDLTPQRALGAFMLGLAGSRHGDIQSGAQEAERHFEVTRSQGFLGVFPAMALAEALARSGRVDDALMLLNRTLEALPAPETGIFVSELWRQRGELMVAGDCPNPKAAEHDLRTALRIATAQGAVTYRLRAVIALARLLAASGRVEEAQAQLTANADATGLDPGLEELRALRSLCAEIVR